MTLAETQALLHGALTGTAPPGALEACLLDTPGLAAVEGAGLYAAMYRARLTGALREVFPALARGLGPARFEALAEAYLARHPSEHHDVGRVGRRLPGFLRRHPAPERSDLADLAALEWARHRVFFARPVVAAGPGAFAAIAPEAFAEVRLRLSPALVLLRLRHDVAPAWRDLTAGEAAGPARPAPTALAVWRRGFEVFHAPLGPAEAEALRIARSATMGEALAPFASGPDPAAAARQALAGWLGEGWIVSVRAPGLA
ncbi:MAG: putative DNA-binding domain-containing protein [Anaeromyxobacter sp.]|nr:putative DNA-binding domain-containing protein [Anaeromyxobacter sp.]MBL0275195.1 putative DNA-binding domain-containing protein [Anaeromyxobacter sp.]